MTPLDADHNRKIAAMLADSLAPLLADLPVMPPPPRRVIREAFVAADAGLVRLIEQVASAVDKFDQAKFGPEEGLAWNKVLRAAKSLRTEWRMRQKNRLPSPNQEPKK